MAILQIIFFSRFFFLTKSISCVQRHTYTLPFQYNKYWKC